MFTSLLQEYHDLYELQRKRLESRIGEGCRVMGSACMQCARLVSRSLSEYMSTWVCACVCTYVHVGVYMHTFR